ncbi:MAG: hypothetical protein IT174_00150, partial [Acidobacteria bacterium]|nr:hypothetical protein [Acidobacteriota bacterium]
NPAVRLSPSAIIFGRDDRTCGVTSGLAAALAACGCFAAPQADNITIRKMEPIAKDIRIKESIINLVLNQGITRFGMMLGTGLPVGNIRYDTGPN